MQMTYIPVDLRFYAATEPPIGIFRFNYPTHVGFVLYAKIEISFRRKLIRLFVLKVLNIDYMHSFQAKLGDIFSSKELQPNVHGSRLYYNLVLA